jgi:CTP synthase
MTKFIFITGGVVSSLGKGIASASLGALLQARGYKVRLRKFDPYLNIDPGTMSPYQHGEVYVTGDGAETDLDLGHYERLTGVDARRDDSISAGKIYSQLLTKERRGDYLGGTVQVIPHVTDLIKKSITANCEDADFLLCEIGGTVGDIEALPFFEAIRQLGNDLGRDNVLYIHLTLVPYLAAARELKTKPTQHSVKELRSIGIQPNILLCRSDREIPSEERKKIGLFCNLPQENVIQALDQKCIYRVPIAYHKENFDRIVLSCFNLPSNISPDLSKWEDIVNRKENPKSEVNIAIVGKYNRLKDAYKSLIEALDHAGIHHNCNVKLHWMSAANINEENVQNKLSGMHGLLVPGGFGNRGVEGKITAIKYAREHNLPFFGICLGMQLAAIEIARNILGINDASSTEFTPNCTNIIGLMTEWRNNGQSEERRHDSDMGGTMRLGNYTCSLMGNTKVKEIYAQAPTIIERHRHRYEFNINYKQQFEQAGITFSGISADNELVEIIEIGKHPWFIGVQFHPELKSRPFSPHPLFTSFINAAINISKGDKS